MKHCVYRFKDKEDNIIYVGYTKNINRRMEEHFGWLGHLDKECYNEVFKIEYSRFETSVEAKYFEASYISEIKPKYNQTYSSKTITMLIQSVEWVVFEKEIKPHKIMNLQNKIFDEEGAIKFETRMNLGQIIINNETGEILNTGKLDHTSSISSKKLCKEVVDMMLEKAKTKEDLDSDMLWAWCKIKGFINLRGQVKLLGSYIDQPMNKKLLEDIILTGYVMRIVDCAHNFSCILMKNRQTSISTWKELYDKIGLTGNTKTQQKVKKFLERHKIVRTTKIVNMKGFEELKFILNPFLFRGASYSSQIAIMLFQDFVNEGVNISCYPLRWLQSIGYVNIY